MDKESVPLDGRCHKGEKMNQIRLENSTMVLLANQDTGQLYSLKLKGDELGTEFLGNPENVSYPSILEMNQWMGDVKIRVWDKQCHDWTEELTSRSDDIRNVVSTPGEGKMTVFYERQAKNEKGIRSVFLKEVWQMQEDGLHWYLTIKNPGKELLEVGEVSLAFLTNTDFTGIFENPEYEGTENWRGLKQKLWHEQRVQQYLSINGGSSYAWLQRPKGDFPGLLFQVLDDGEIEEAYQMDSKVGCQWSLTFEGPYYLSLYSSAARKCGGWKYETAQQTYGVNGNTALLLEGEEEKQFHFVFRPVAAEEEIAEYLWKEGQLDISVQPSMAVPAGVPIRVRIRSREVPRLIPLANGIELELEQQNGDSWYYRLVFSEPGQKKLRIFHGGRKTTVCFYALDNIRNLLENHAEFIIRRQYYQNPLDPFGRNHAFLPYDDAVEMIFTESEESWQVGGLDEYALPVAMFLAEKNSILPRQNQVDVLEEYIDTCLYGILQDKETFYARRGMYYEERTPSDIWTGNKWDKEKAESPLRSFNYPLITDIYYSMYKIADKYQMTHIRSKMEYLEMAYQTALTGYELGRNKYNGAPAGATITALLETLKKENKDWYGRLNEKVEWIAEENSRSEYPFGSELYVDQTAHNQYEAMMTYYEKKDRLEEAYRVTYALRCGWQPQWYLYGNEKRGNVCCWYGTPLNSRVLFDGFEFTGKQAMLKLGYGGLSSFLTCIRSNGAAHGWYLWWPDRSGFDLRSLDTDMGMYGYLRSARCYVVDDPVFGRCGYGCILEKAEEVQRVVPYDGLGIRFFLEPFGVTVECEKGTVKELQIQERNRSITVEIENPEQSWLVKVQTKTRWNIIIGDENKTLDAESSVFTGKKGRH